MPKKYEVNYTLTFHVEAEDKKEAGEMGEEAFGDYLKNIGSPTHRGFDRQITEVKE